MSFGESSESENPSTSELPNDGKQSQGTTKACPGATATDKKPAHQSVAVEDALVLANVIGKLTIESNELFALAKKSFEKAGEEATRAFHNAALSTDERILASKVRIASGILEHLDRPEVAATDCLHYLRELHDMPAIKEIFSVHVGTGIKSWFKSGLKKDSRVEIVKTVTLINLILADFISKFTKRRMAVFDWPMIECGKRVVHPIHFKTENVPNLKEMQITPPWDIVVSDDDLLTGATTTTYEAISVQKAPVLTTKGDLIYFTDDRRGLQKLDTTTGKLQPYCLSPLKDNTEHPQPSSEFIGIAIDENDTVYVLSRDDKDGYTLSVYSRDGRNTHHNTLEFLQGVPDFECITVSNNKNIVICFKHEHKIMVYSCNCKGKLINSSELALPIDPDNCLQQSVSVSCDNEIILTTWQWNEWTESEKDTNVLYIFSAEGQLKTTVKFRPSESGHIYGSLFYNHDSKTIIGHVEDYGDNKTLIQYLSGQTAKLQLSYLLYDTNFPESIFSFFPAHHTNGALALVSKKYVIFLQKPSP
ncbi:Hypothetical predicted protein [Paramuricea clavata]|nr:Hypothetical predicted protein [Paramuricea clavata]